MKPNNAVVVLHSPSIRLPTLPNFLTDVGGTTYSVGRFGEKELRAIGAAWTDALVAHAAAKRKPTTPGEMKRTKYGRCACCTPEPLNASGRCRFKCGGIGRCPVEPNSKRKPK